MTVKENVNPDLLLEKPKDVIEEPFPIPESPGTAKMRMQKQLENLETNGCLRNVPGK